MAAKVRKDALASEVSALNSLIASLDEDDFISRRSLEYKRNELAGEVEALSQQIDTSGRVVLSFEGGPVTGSRGIDATFAAKTLEDYQTLLPSKSLRKKSRWRERVRCHPEA